MIGEKANIKVDTRIKRAKDKEPESVPVFASAHDLRRSFGERWASRLMPKELMELMRHKSINTTMMFYVGSNAEKTAGILWEVYRNTSYKKPPYSGTSSDPNLGTSPDPDLGTLSDPNFEPKPHRRLL